MEDTASYSAAGTAVETLADTDSQSINLPETEEERIQKLLSSSDEYVIAADYISSINDHVDIKW